MDVPLALLSSDPAVLKGIAEENSMNYESESEHITSESAQMKSENEKIGSVLMRKMKRLNIGRIMKITFI